MTNESNIPEKVPLIVLDPHTPSLNEEAFVHQFSRRVVGQPAAEEIARMAHNAYSNPFRDKNRPIGIYFLVGPSRTGKSLTGEVLAEIFHGDAKALTRLQCADYEADHQVADLKGSPNGYVGYKDPDKYKVNPEDEDATSIISAHNLKRVRLQSDKEVDIVILEEFEKSGYDFYKLWMGVFDKGVLRLGNGKLVDFTNTIFVLTSNLGMDKLEKQSKGSIGFTNTAKAITRNDVASVVDEEMKLRFKPEFRNRLDAVVIFQPFTGGDLSRVVEAEVALLQERINKQAPGGKKFTITVDKSARDKLLAATGNNVAELKRVIAAQINIPLGRLYNTGKITAGCTLFVTYSDKIGNYEFAMQPGVPEPAKTDATATGDKDQSKTGADNGTGNANGNGTKDGSGKPTLHLPKKDTPKTNLPAVVKNAGDTVPPNHLQKYAVQALAKSFYDAEEKADEVMHYLTDVLTVDVLYEVLTHKEPYSFSVMVMASLEQLELLKLKLPYVVYRKQGS
jgi:ATP-dependent Clp protease ATP-binding subunit ClpB